MIINTSNYEAYALDYLEGNLPLAEAREMELFLAAQPAIAAELEAMRPLVTLTPNDSIVFEPKNLLLKKEKRAAVVWLNPQVRRRLAAAAAAVLLLSAGYFIGFKNGLETKTIQADNTPAIQIEQTQTPENIVADEPAIAQVNESPVDAKAVEKRPIDVKKNAPFKEKVTSPVKYEIATPTPIVENSIAQDENLDKPKQKETQTLEFEPPNEINTTAIAQVEALESLPSLELNEVQSEFTSVDYVFISNSSIAITERKERNASKLLKGLLGRLPFEGLTAQNFVPTYYSDNVDNVGE